MNFNKLWADYQQKAKDIRPFLRTKIGKILTLIAVIDFFVLFFAPLMHGFVGTAIFGCVGSVYLVLIWRKYDKEHVIVPTAILCIPLLLDMLIYVWHENIGAIIVGCLVSIAAMLIAALSRFVGFYDKVTDLITSLLVAGGICVGVVVLACVMLIIVSVAWWILCIIAFIIVVAVFMGVVFSTAAYTASDGRRQARKNREREADADEESAERRREYQPRRRETKIYNLDEDDFREIDE